jgi:hypothetical protein
MILLVMGMALLVPAVATGQVIFLETYDTSFVGFAPFAPIIGFRVQLVGDHTVVDQGGGDYALRSVTDGTDGGFLINYGTTALTPNTTTTYQFLIEDGSGPVGANAFLQELILRPLGVNIMLYWGNDYRLWISTTAPGYDSPLLRTEFSWAVETLYDVVVVVTGGAAGTFDLMINNTLVADDHPLNYEVTGLKYLAFACNTVTTSSQILDNIQVIGEQVVPNEQTTWGGAKALYR